jgi:REP element-mobilizing transposase RayT
MRRNAKAKEEVMARTNRINKACANYHIMSRTNGRQFLFKNGRLKSVFVNILRRSAEFSGVKIHAYCMMDDHFHLVCNIAKPDNPLPENEVLRRIGVLKGASYGRMFAEKLQLLRNSNSREAVEVELDKWRKRMNDVSEFVKTFKELINIAYKKEHPYCGSIWSGRFKSTLIEEGKYLRNCIRYVEYNPVRAGMVTQAKEYAWSSRNAAIYTDIQMGSVPMGAGRRCVYIGSGVILGSKEFVEMEIGHHSGCFHGSEVKARQVAGAVYAAYGQRLAKKSA